MELLTAKKLKKKINQNNQTSKAADCAGQLRKTSATGQPWGWGRLPSSACFVGRADLRGKLRLRADWGLWLGLPQWEILPVSHKSSWKSALETSR